MSERIHKKIIADQTMARESGYAGSFPTTWSWLLLVCGVRGGLEHH